MNYKKGGTQENNSGGSEREEINNDHNTPYRDSNGQSSFPSFINKLFSEGQYLDYRISSTPLHKV